jgi:DNA-binding transcriptional regulator of glucitol operon
MVLWVDEGCRALTDKLILPSLCFRKLQSEMKNFISILKFCWIWSFLTGELQIKPFKLDSKKLFFQLTWRIQGTFVASNLEGRLRAGEIIERN